MAGVISLTHPVPSADPDDLNIEAFNSDSDGNNSPIPNGTQIEPINSFVTTEPLKQEGNKHKKTYTTTFRQLKSRSEGYDNETDPDLHSDTTHSTSHKHKESPYLPQFHGLRLCYRPSIYIADYKSVFKEIIAGVIVSFAQVPESISFAMIGNLPPIFGLHSAWLIGGLVALTGGRPGMISGATGGMGAILAPLMEDPDFINYLPYTIILSGILVTICGFCGIGKFARLIPQTVMIGFLNGLAIIILKSQFHLFHHAHGWEDYLSATLLAIITFCIVQFLPKLTKLIPSSLAAILIATLVEYLIIRLAIGHHTPLIGDMVYIKGSLPQPFWCDNHEYFTNLPPLNSSETWSKLMLPIILVTLVSIIEDAMTVDVVTDVTHTKLKHLPRHTKQQQISMGLANVIAGMFTTMGGHGMIGCSMVSCHSGSTGVYRISGVVASIFTFIIVMFASPLIDMVPYAALVGIMLAVVGHTFEWRSITMVISAALPRKLRRKLPEFMKGTKIRRGDAIVIVIVTIFVVVVNLAYAVILGIVIASLVYTWYSGFSFHVHKEYVHVHHLRDKRHIRKFSDFHIHYHPRGHGTGSHHGREHSVETIDTLDPHYIDPHNDHYGYSDHHSDHHRSYSDLPQHNNNHSNGMNGIELMQNRSFSAENRFTELHEIKDINHLDTFMSNQEEHMEALKEAANAADEEPTPKAKDLNSTDFKDLKPIFFKDLENIKSINDTFRTDKTDDSQPQKKKDIPTFEVHGIEHGTLRNLKIENFAKSFERKLSDDENDCDVHAHERLSDCTNPDDIESFVGRMNKKFNKDYILVYHFEGPLFFGNCRNLLDYFDPKNDPDHIEIHLRDACIYDFSAMNALNQVGEEYDQLNKTVHLRHINNKSHKLIAKANHLVKYFSYEDILIPPNINDPKNKNKINIFSNDNSITNNGAGGNIHGEREISKSQSLLQLGTPNQYRFRMNPRYV